MQTPVFLLRVIQLVRWAILACLAHKSRVARLTSLVPFVSWKHSIKAEHIKNGPMLLKLLGKIWEEEEESWNLLCSRYLHKFSFQWWSMYGNTDKYFLHNALSHKLVVWTKRTEEDILKKFLQRKFYEYIIKGFFIALCVAVVCSRYKFMAIFKYI